MHSFTIEVVASSVLSCIRAQAGGAGRIELCSALATAGVTPSSGLLESVKKLISVPVYVMIRPREGDFCYDKTEVDVMKSEIENLQKSGADGFVFGVLHADGRVDTKLTSELVNFCKPYPVTFHRAFDCTPFLSEALEAVIESGCERILTSGGKSSGPEGVEHIAELAELAGDRIFIMPGGGIRPDTFPLMLRKNIREYHLSGRLPVQSTMPSTLFDMNWAETDEASIREVVGRAQTFFSSSL
ncbi:MAG: copper homeostasis protein CutC [Flavobacteriales bacterium]|nr:copper homeostasis protein CutC [Flavobacteriales bacterium]